MDEGYEDSRFEIAIDANFHCQICMNVLQEPMQCRSNEHLFCSPCIRRHLEQNSQSCPMCMDELTVETLGRAPRVVADYLSRLKISCDYAARGCREVIELGVLESHVGNCDFSPVACSNDGCLEVVNKKDVEHHETKACGFRKTKCDDCGKEMPRLKYDTHGCLLRREIIEIKKNLTEMKCMQEEMMKEMKTISTEMASGIGVVREEMKSITTEVNNVKQSVQDLCGIKNRDIVVIGGLDDKDKALPSAERFTWFDRKWTPLPQMKESRVGAAVVMFDNKILVCGGGTARGILTDGIEVMNMSEKPEQWLDFPSKLPLKCAGHKCVVYGNRLLVIGGVTDESHVSNGIYEVLLVPPYSSKLLCQMGQKRCYHGVELFDDKIVIAGGSTSTNSKNGLSNVEIYDISKNQCKEMTPLPSGLMAMATVGWKSNMILMGGANNKGVTNAVIAYDFETGKSKGLPSMGSERYGATAVVSENTIVVMGGRHKDGTTLLDSAESFSFLFNSWKELPSMIEPRDLATACFVKSETFERL